MGFLEILGLIIAISILAALLSFFLIRKTIGDINEPHEGFPEYTEKEKQLAKEAEQLYNKPVEIDLTTPEPDFIKKEEETPVKKKRKYYYKKKNK